MHSLLELAWVMVGLKLTPATSYTAFNLCAIAIVYWRRHRSLYPVLFANSLALHASFYCMQLLIDRSFFGRMMRVYNCTQFEFIIGDIVVHWLPSILFLLSLFVRKDAWIEICHEYPRSVHFAGLYSLLLNLGWAMLNAPNYFDISNVYVPLCTEKWNSAWHLCALSHLGFGALLVKTLATMQVQKLITKQI